MEPVTVTINNTMSTLGIGRTKIYQLIASGDLKTVKIGRRRLVRLDSICALVGQTA